MRADRRLTRLGHQNLLQNEFKIGPIEHDADVLRLRNRGDGQGGRVSRDTVGRQHIDGERVGDGER